MLCQNFRPFIFILLIDIRRFYCIPQIRFYFRYKRSVIIVKRDLAFRKFVRLPAVFRIYGGRFAVDHQIRAAAFRRQHIYVMQYIVGFVAAVKRLAGVR